jgi:hypothetical protein
MAPADSPAQHKHTALLVGGGVAAAAVAAMAWRALAGSGAAAILPPAERVQQLAQAEQLFASKFPTVSEAGCAFGLLLLCCFTESL